jgi:carboxyl-terminal processing protease
MPKITKLVIGLLLVVVVALAFGGGFMFGAASHSQSEPGLDIIGQAWNIISTEYVDKSKLNSENMSRAAIEGIIETLDDPYTSYLDAREYQLGQSIIQGEFDGIGAMVTVKDKQLTIIAPIAGSPADKAGIKAGDIILQINGEPVADMSLAEAIIKIRGPKGTAVKLLVQHEGETGTVEIEIIRGRVEVPSVHFRMEGDIAYINITQFSERTESELAPIIQDLKTKNARGIVLDLRGNPGGLLDTVVEVASHFISQGIIVEVKSNQGVLSTLEVIQGMTTTDIPMVVLVDNASASGSEVLAGALQDYNRALIAGNVTYGKGSVNMLRQLSDGSGLYITTARWLTPRGRLIEGHGIEPDKKLDLIGDDAVRWAVGYLTAGSDKRG